MKKETVLGWATGLFAFFIFMSWVPKTTCQDGWKSPSIGRPGACSHHGGVDSHGELRLLALIGAIIAGVGVYNFLKDKTEKPKENKQQLNPTYDYTPQELYNKRTIEESIRTNRKIEFMYKKARDTSYKKRTINPIRFTSFPNNICILGMCELRNAERNFALSRMTDLKII